MAWNPDKYNQFKTERYQPFYDLLALCKEGAGMTGIDLGCGTGELTRMLADHLPGLQITGIDSSKEMLEKAAGFQNDRVHFVCRSIQDQIKEATKFDFIFSNAALQWVDDHPKLLSAIIRMLNKEGQLAVQVPSNHDHFTHTFLLELAARVPFKKELDGWHRVNPVLSINEYAQILFDEGASENIVFEKVYPHVLKDSDDIFDWVSGTALIPYLEKLPRGLRQRFKDEYRKALADRFPGSPVFYPFKRILMKATF